jgi:hypothetical protein
MKMVSYAVILHHVYHRHIEDLTEGLEIDTVALLNLYSEPLEIAVIVA